MSSEGFGYEEEEVGTPSAGGEGQGSSGGGDKAPQEGSFLVLAGRVLSEAAEAHLRQGEVKNGQRWAGAPVRGDDLSASLGEKLCDSAGRWGGG